MWRQADNPLAPGDKYEVRRTFSAARLHSVSRGKKKKEGPPCSHHANPTAEPRWEVTQSSDYDCNWQTLSLPVRRYANIFFLSHIFPDIYIFAGEGGATRTKIADDSFAHGTC